MHSGIIESENDKQRAQGHGYLAGNGRNSEIWEGHTWADFNHKLKFFFS